MDLIIENVQYDIAAPAGMIGTSNFFELAVAVSVALFRMTSPAVLEFLHAACPVGQAVFYVQKGGRRRC